MSINVRGVEVDIQGDELYEIVRYSIEHYQTVMTEIKERKLTFSDGDTEKMYTMCVDAIFGGAIQSL